VSGSGISWDICKSAPRPRQITTTAAHYSQYSVFCRPSCRPTNSVRALKANQSTEDKSQHSRQSTQVFNYLTYSLKQHKYPEITTVSITMQSIGIQKKRLAPHQVQNWLLSTSLQCSVPVVEASFSPPSECLLSCSETRPILLICITTANITNYINTASKPNEYIFKT